jgi:DnaJ-class molecular chaperone
MNLAVQLAVALHATGAPNPAPTNAAAAGSATGPAAETSTSSTAADIASALGPTGMMLALALAAFAVYVVSLSLHPNAKCNRCKGAGRHRGAIFSYAQRPCNSCKGRGVHPRLGRKVLFKT